MTEHLSPEARHGVDVSKRVLHLLLLMTGAIGLGGCVAAVAGTWGINARIGRLTGNAFEAVDDSLTATAQRLAATQTRVDSLQITAHDVEQSMKRWTAAQARERLAARLEVDERAERLASGLAQADHWLEVAESSAQLVQRALEVVSSLGAPVQMDRADRLPEELTALREQLTSARDSVKQIRERSAEADDEASSAGRLTEAVQFALRVTATLGAIDARLAGLHERITDIRSKTHDAERTLLRWVRAAAIGITLLVAWTAAGQGALCYIGWRGLRRRST